MTPHNDDDYSRVEVPLNVTLLGTKVGYRITSLDSLKQAFFDLSLWSETVSPQELRSTIEELSLPALFNLMVESLDDDLIKHIKKICTNFLATLPSSFLLREDFFPFLAIGLQNSEPEVVSLALEQLLRLSPDELASKVQLIAIPLVNQIGSDNIHVFDTAFEIVLKMLVSSHIEPFLDIPEVTSTVLKLFNSSATIRIMNLVFQVITSTPEDDPVSIQILDKKELISPIFACLRTTDLLLKLNIIEVYSQFIKCPKIYNLMKSYDVFSQMLESLTSKANQLESVENSVEIIVFSSELSFLATSLSSISEPEYIDNIIKIIECLIVDENHPGFQIAAFNSISKLVEINVLLPRISDSSSILNQIANSFYNSSINLRQEALANIATSMGSSENPSELLNNYIDKLFHMLKEKGKFTETIIKLSFDPEDKVKGLSFALVYHLTYYYFGLKFILNDPKMMNFLLDRTLDPTPLAQKWKYGIVESLFKRTSHPEVKQSMEAETPNFSIIFNNLKKFVDNGVFFKESTVVVSLDSS